MAKKVLGFTIIAVGFLLLLSNLEVVSITNIWKYIWTIGFIIVGLSGLIEKKSYDFFFSILILIGVLYLLKALNIITGNVVGLLFIPIIMMGIGISLLVTFKFKGIDGKVKKYFAIFSGVEEKIEDKKYKGSEILIIFGGVDIDLRNVKFDSKTAYINVLSAFGGATIIVPENVRVVTRGIPLFGGCENKARTNENFDNELIVNYNIIFGGIEIKN